MPEIPAGSGWHGALWVKVVMKWSRESGLYTSAGFSGNLKVEEFLIFLLKTPLVSMLSFQLNI